MNIKNYIFSMLVLMVLFVAPLRASAHAMPTLYLPESSGIIATSSESVLIHFSERIDSSASSLAVTGPSGARVEVGRAHTLPNDPRALLVPVRADGDGTYLVTWSVVSSDDGHFTKGTYVYGVGEGTKVSEVSATSEVVQIATFPEILGMTVELGGNGLLWAMCLLFIFCIRPLIRTGAYGKNEVLIHKVYGGFILGGVVAVVLGGAFQLYTKSLDLAGLQAITVWNALPLYVHTAAGGATFWRIICALGILALYAVGRKLIAKSARVTPYEWLMIGLLLIFAYLRAKISHATANPFFPDLSIAVNFVHLIEKDVWSGMLAILLVILLIPRLRALFDDLVPKVSALIVLDLALVSVTASYIIWLHLHTFSNLFTTQWGSALLSLVIAAVLLVGMRVYHVGSRFLIPSTYSKLLPFTLAAELAFGVLVLFASSAIIITSPPLSPPAGSTYSANDQGAHITLARALHEGGMVLLTIEGTYSIEEPLVTITTESNSVAFPVEVHKRFAGGYVFPSALMSQKESSVVTISAPQTGAYDATATFTVSPGAFTNVPTTEGGRTFDSFTIVMILIACAALVFTFFVRSLVRRASVQEGSVRTNSFTPLLVLPAFLCALYVGGMLMSLPVATGLANPFKVACESDGNMWHIMEPTRAGIPIASLPAEGCMWGMGNYPYLFSDKREYDYYRTLGEVDVSFPPDQSLHAGVPITFTASLKEKNGAPATLFVDMEKLIHVVVVSEDQTVFAHIHPDDSRPLTKEEITNSTFKVTYTFPKAGKYIVALDYAHGVVLGSKHFILDVSGAPNMATEPVTYPTQGDFGGYQVRLSYGVPQSGAATTLSYEFSKDGKPVTTLEPYLSAAMHIAVVKNDFSAFLHTHGETHSPGQPYPPIIIKNGQVVHSMATMTTPATFGPRVEAHLIFPKPGRYTVWGQFKINGSVIPSAFTVDVE